MAQTSQRLRVLTALVAALLITSPIGYSRGQGMVNIDFVETDKQAYQIGENVNVTSAWHIYFDNGFQYSEGIIACLRGSSPLASERWLNETEGYHVHGMTILLEPDKWDPGQNGENGTIESTISLLPEGGYQFQRHSFLVARAGQNCMLTNVIPNQPAANISLISMSLRICNRNNSSFGVGLNRVYFNITNPHGRLTTVNGSCFSDLDGNLVISFNPEYVYGRYSVSLKSTENRRYTEGRFNYSIEVDRSSIPTDLSLDWRYVGETCNSTTSYALEPTEITSRLTCSLNGTGISAQQLDLRVLDSSDFAIVCQMKETTNASGFVTSIFEMPYEGEFILEANYDGLVNSWLASSKTLNNKIKVAARELSIVQLNQLPTIVALNHNYTVEYLILDALSNTPVPNLEVKAKIDSHLLAEGTTDNKGEVRFDLCLPVDDHRLAGNETLHVETLPRLFRKVYGVSDLYVPLFCKIPTIINLRVFPQTVIEGGEMVSVLSELLYSDLSPIPRQNMTLMIFTNQGQTLYGMMSGTTDSSGRCSASFRLLQDGAAKIVALFGGNDTLIASNCTCTLSVLPVFKERLSSSIPTVATACLLAVISLLVASRTRRRVKWHDIPACQPWNKND